MTRMHPDELDISEALARRLIREQFPQWADLPLTRVKPEGTVNAIFRMGTELSVRLPRRDGPTEPGGREFEWLPRIAGHVPLEVPTPVAQGQPSAEFPWFWEIHSWVHGETVTADSIDSITAARDLAGFISSLQRIDPKGAPKGRGIPLAERAADMEHWFGRFNGDPSFLEVWKHSLAAPAWQGPPLWSHGDLDARNWLVRDGRISGVIDWDSMGVGDPACDLMVAWKLHSANARDAFRATVVVDDATWDRARGWVVSQAVAILAYYTLDNNPALFREAESWLDLVLSERKA
jgi:aminoglycoside phosphotransferase (APT) family kinase protein